MIVPVDIKRRCFLANHRGYTMLELLTVLTIVGILAGLGVVSHQRGRERALVRQAKIDLRMLVDAVKAFNMRCDCFDASCADANKNVM